MMRQFDLPTSRTMTDIYPSHQHPAFLLLLPWKLASDRLDSLVLFFKPLFADRIDFLEWETFFFGAARRMEGKSSKRDSKAVVHRETISC